MLWICDDCTTAYSVGAPRCPHCGSTAHHDQGDDTMAKITKSKGATQGAPDDSEPESAPDEEAAPAKKPAAKKAAKKTTTKRG